MPVPIQPDTYDEQEQPQGQMPMPYGYGGFGAFQSGDKADLLDKINPDLIVETIMHRLMGEELINGKWEKIPELQSRAISFKCAWDIANIMLPNSSQNVSLSKINDNEIRNRTLEVVKTVQKMLLKNWQEYHIHGTDQMWFIHQIVMSNTFITLKQPEGEGIRNLVKGVRTEQMSYTDQIAEKKGFLGGIFRR